MKNIFSYLLFLSCSLVFSQETEEVYAKNEEANDEKVIALGQALANSFYEEEPSTFFFDNFNLDAFAKKVVAINPEINDENAVKEFRETYRKETLLETFDQFPEMIKALINAGASYSIVNFYYHLDEKKYHVLFRLYTEEEGLNYHDYQLGYEDGEFKLHDIFVYATGQYLSQTYQDLYLLRLPDDDEKVTKERKKTMLFFTLYHRFVPQKKYKEAFALLSTLEGEFTTKKIYHSIKMRIASNINDVFHLEAIDEFLKAFPEDTSTKLSAIDYYFMLKDYNAIMLILDDLQATTEDPFIDYIRANIAWEFQDYELAEKGYANTVKEYPGYENAKLNLMYLYDFLEKHEDNIVLLNSMIESEEYLKKDLIEFIDDSSNEFIHLPNARIYNRWKKQK